MPFIVVIPARFASQRLPGKPLKDILGKPMIQHVYEQACESEADRVVIATDDQRILDCAESFGAEAVMTDPGHPSGTDRIEEVARKMALRDDEIVVNVQGDEPLIPPELINQVAQELSRVPGAGLSTLCEPIETKSEWLNPNVVKVVSDLKGRALYFSRAPVPFDRDNVPSSEDFSSSSAFRHIGMYAYRVSFLKQYVTWSPSPLECIEKLEQLRAMEHGIDIFVAKALVSPAGGVDTLEDLERVRKILSS